MSNIKQTELDITNFNITELSLIKERIFTNSIRDKKNQDTMQIKQDLIDLCNQYPNDSDLGNNIRKFISEL